MEHFAYDTPDYDMLYHKTRNRWIALSSNNIRFEEAVERNVRKLCKLISDSSLGVTMFSCEGHPEQFKPELKNHRDTEGYVMIVPRNGDSATRLLRILNQVQHDLMVEFGWNACGEVEANIATHPVIEASYPCVVLRSPMFKTKRLRNTWWSTVTKAFKTHSKGSK